MLYAAAANSGKSLSVRLRNLRGRLAFPQEFLQNWRLSRDQRGIEGGLVAILMQAILSSVVSPLWAIFI